MTAFLRAPRDRHLTSCWLLRGADDRPVGRGGQAGRVADWRMPCQAVTLASDATALRRALETHFQPFEVVAVPAERGLFTGYYEPELRGATAPDQAHRWPLYRPPKDLVSADLTLFDAQRIADQATYAEGGRPSVGIAYVLVNGQAVVDNYRFVEGVKPGRPILGLKAQR